MVESFEDDIFMLLHSLKHASRNRVTTTLIHHDCCSRTVPCLWLDQILVCFSVSVLDCLRVKAADRIHSRKNLNTSPLYKLIIFFAKWNNTTANTIFFHIFASLIANILLFICSLKYEPSSLKLCTLPLKFNTTVTIEYKCLTIHYVNVNRLCNWKNVI